jgi:hypothetical protein
MSGWALTCGTTRWMGSVGGSVMSDGRGSYIVRSFLCALNLLEG